MTRSGEVGLCAATSRAEAANSAKPSPAKSASVDSLRSIGAGAFLSKSF
jgi:hypothetical protein